MARKSPEEHFQDYVDSAFISLIIPLVFAAPYQASQSVPLESLGLASGIPFVLLSLFFFVLFLLGLAGSALRGGLFGGAGFLIGNYGVNTLLTDPLLSVLIMGFGALMAYAGTSARTRTEFQRDMIQTLDDLGI